MQQNNKQTPFFHHTHLRLREPKFHELKHLNHYINTSFTIQSKAAIRTHKFICFDKSQMPSKETFTKKKATITIKIPNKRFPPHKIITFPTIIRDKLTASCPFSVPNYLIQSGELST